MFNLVQIYSFDAVWRFYYNNFVFIYTYFILLIWVFFKKNNKRVIGGYKDRDTILLFSYFSYFSNKSIFKHSLVVSKDFTIIFADIKFIGMTLLLFFFWTDQEVTKEYKKYRYDKSLDWRWEKDNRAFIKEIRDVYVSFKKEETPYSVTWDKAYFSNYVIPGDCPFVTKNVIDYNIGLLASKRLKKESSLKKNNFLEGNSFFYKKRQKYSNYINTLLVRLN